MAFIPVPGVVQVELIYQWDSQTVETVLHYDADDPIDSTEYAAMGAQLVTLWNANLKGAISTPVTLTQIKFTDLSADIGPVLNYSTGLPLVGTLTGPSLPNNCALVITKRTPLRGRSYRGRIYHPGLGEADVTANAVAAARVTALLTAYGALRTFTAGAKNYYMCVVSRYTDNAPRVTGIATRVNGFTTDGMVDSQRRRLPGRGR